MRIPGVRPGGWSGLELTNALYDYIISLEIGDCGFWCSKCHFPPSKAGSGTETSFSNFPSRLWCISALPKPENGVFVSIRIAEILRLSELSVYTEVVLCCLTAKTPLARSVGENLISNKQKRAKRIYQKRRRHGHYKTLKPIFLIR